MGWLPDVENAGAPRGACPVQAQRSPGRRGWLASSLARDSPIIDRATVLKLVLAQSHTKSLLQRLRRATQMNDPSMWFAAGFLQPVLARKAAYAFHVGRIRTPRCTEFPTLRRRPMRP